MHIAPRSALAAAIVILSATAACGGDSTGPGSTTTNLAVHFDSLYVTAKALSAANASYDFRTIALSDLELPAAFGGTPTNIAMTTATGTESWKGFVFEEVLTDNGVPADSGRLLLAYRDADVHTLVVTVLRADGSSEGASLMTNDTIIVQASSNAGSITQTAVGTSCPAPPAGLTNPVITTAAQATCLLATYSATLTLGFPATTGVDPALTHLSFPPTTFGGERFQDPFGASTSRVSSVWQRASLRRG
jgi:hypothetical protein